jgi:cell division protein FtsB
MNVDLGIWSKLSRLVVFLLFLAGLFVVGIWYLPLIRQNERMRKNILQFDAQIRKEEEKARQYKLSMDALRYDPKSVERLARETMGFAKPGETIIRFEPPVTNATVSSHP